MLVQPSRADNLPLAILEAMAAGLPVVGARVGGIPELVADGETGFVVDAESPPALAEALERWPANPELRRELGRRGRSAWPSTSRPRRRPPDGRALRGAVRILHVIQELGTGGAEQVLVSAYRGARTAGHEVFVAAAPGPLAARLEREPLPLPLVERRPWRVPGGR